MFISQAFAQTAPAASRRRHQSSLLSLLPLVLMFVVLYFIMIRPADEAPEGAQGDGRGAGQGRRGRHRRRRARARVASSARPTCTSRSPTASSCRCSAARSSRCCPRARSSDASRRLEGRAMNRYPWWKYAILGDRAGGRPALHAAQLLRRGAGGAGVQRQGHAQGRLRRSSARVQRILRSRRRHRSRTSCSSRATRSRRASPTPIRRSRPRTRSPGRSTRIRTIPSYIVALNLLSRSPQWLASAARAADVPRPRPARRRALPDAGRHESGADQEGRGARRRRAHAAARQEHPPCRHRARRQRSSRCASATRATLDAARKRCWPTSCPTCSGSRPPTAADFKLTGTLKPEAARARAGAGAQAEHHHAAQPRQRARRGRAGDPAAGRRPRGRAAARRAGHGQGQGHHRPHRRRSSCAWST